jgi:hypothetical protein
VSTHSKAGELQCRLTEANEYKVTPEGVLHVPTEAGFVPNPSIPTSGWWRTGKLGTASGEGYEPEKVKQEMRRLCAEHLINAR